MRCTARFQSGAESPVLKLGWNTLSDPFRTMLTQGSLRARLTSPFGHRSAASRGTRPTMKRKKLGEVLQERGKISATDLARVVQEQQGKVIRLGELMLKRGLVDKADLATALEE